MVALALTVMADGANAGSRLGSATDDSVCDVGDTARRVAGVPTPEAYIKSMCRNGQVLIGSSVVPLGQGQPEISVLAIKNCVAADIESRRSTENIGGLVMEVERVRCRISKLVDLAPRSPR